MMKIPVRYLPFGLSNKDSLKQAQMLKKSRSEYKKGKYFTRKPVKSFHSRPSNHIKNAQKIYGVEKIAPIKELAKATGCSIDALNQIVKKGEGAYFSSGSRPNQTAQSWGYARLASSLTAGKAAAVDYSILEKGCSKGSKALTLAKKVRGHGQSTPFRIQNAQRGPPFSLITAHEVGVYPKGEKRCKTRRRVIAN